MDAALILIYLLLATLLAGLPWLAKLHKNLQLAQHTQLQLTQKIQLQKQQSREEKERLLNTLPEALLIINYTATITFANSAAQKLFPQRSLLNRNIREIFLDQRVSSLLLQSLETSQPISQLILLPKQSSLLGPDETRGTTAWHIDVAPLPHLPGKNQKTRVLIRDMTDAHHLEQIRKDFVANASHELRTPLTIINGYMDQLSDPEILQDHQLSQRFLSIMRKHSDRLCRIVEDMLMISRLESGESFLLNLQPFPLQDCILDIKERLESLFTQKQASLHLNIQPESLTILGDRFYWTQIFFNLIENALKQNTHPNLLIEVGASIHQDSIHIWVADNGIGIGSTDLPYIFRRFFRVAKHHSQNTIKGTGLGLSIVKRAIEAHQGTIQVTSNPGTDTRFHIFLPLSNLTQS